MAGFPQIRRIPDGDTYPVTGYHFCDDLLNFRGNFRPYWVVAEEGLEPPTRGL